MFKTALKQRGVILSRLSHSSPLYIQRFASKHNAIKSSSKDNSSSEKKKKKETITATAVSNTAATASNAGTTAATASTASESKSDQAFREHFFKTLDANNSGDMIEFVQLYHDLKEKHLNNLTLHHYNQLLASCAPQKLMFKWYKPYKDYVDMYYEAGKFYAEERMEEANRILHDIEESPLNLRPDIVTYNTMMKVQMSGGYANVVKVFDTFNQLQNVSQRNKKEADMISFTTLLRACSILERVDVAEEIYTFVIHAYDSERFKNLKEVKQDKFQVQVDEPNAIPIQFFNTMLDVYAEAASPYAEVFFHQMIEKKLPIDGVTFNTYAKACIFRDERIKLVEIPELMRVEGVLQRELSQPVREEINAAYNKHTAPLKYKRENQTGRFLKARGYEVPVRGGGEHEDFFEELRNVRPWGRYVDLKDTKFLNLLDYTHLHKFTVNYDLLANTTKISEHPAHSNRPVS